MAANDLPSVEMAMVRLFTFLAWIIKFDQIGLQKAQRQKMQDQD